MAKHVTSRDPRKPSIVAAIKQHAGAARVSCVEEHANGTFTGYALRYVASVYPGRKGGYTGLGTYRVTLNVEDPSGGTRVEKIEEAV